MRSAAGSRESGEVWSAEHARGLLRSCERSGLSIRAWATREGLNPRRLYWWKKRLLHPFGEAQEGTQRFVRAVVKKAITPSVESSAAAAVVIRKTREVTTLEVHAPSQVAPSWIARVLAELEQI